MIPRTLRVTIAITLAIHCTVQAQQNDSDSELSVQLTAHHWHMVAATMIQNGQERDIFTFRPDCQRDDLFIYETNGDFLIQEHEAVCSADQSQASESTWDVQNGVLVITDAQGRSTEFQCEFRSKDEHTQSFRNKYGIQFIWTYHRAD